MITAESFIENKWYRLSGIEYHEKDNAIYLILDDKKYAFEIDPCDGYRDYYVVYEIPEAHIKKLEKPEFIQAELFDDGSEEGVTFYNSDGEMFLRVYTLGYDDYYPRGYIHYEPEYLGCHSDKKEEKDNSYHNKWIDCTEDNYWNSDNDIVCWKDHNDIVCYSMKYECPYGWNVLVRLEAKFMTPSNPFEK